MGGLSARIGTGIGYNAQSDGHLLPGKIAV